MKIYITKTIAENPGISDIALAELVKKTRQELNMICEKLPVVRSVVSSMSGLQVLYYPDAETRERVNPCRTATPQKRVFKTIAPYNPKEAHKYVEDEIMGISPETIKQDIERFLSEPRDTIAQFDFLSDLMTDIGTLLDRAQSTGPKKQETKKMPVKPPVKPEPKKPVAKSGAKQKPVEKPEPELPSRELIKHLIKLVEAGSITKKDAADKLGIHRSTFGRMMERIKNGKQKL